MTEKYNLLPCPFCGGRGHLERSARCFVGGQPSKAAFVRCLDCQLPRPTANALEVGACNCPVV